MKYDARRHREAVEARAEYPGLMSQLRTANDAKAEADERVRTVGSAVSRLWDEEAVRLFGPPEVDPDAKCLCAIRGGVFCSGCPVHDSPRNTVRDSR